MYKLLIVDDEYWIRKRLLTTIDWKSIGISEIFEAEDGRQAFNLAVENEPDIIVTDINMPNLSGIELMQSLNESALYPRIVLISGHNEFEYARSAIKYGAVEYLLKPIDEDELIKTVNNCIRDFEKEKRSEEILGVLEQSAASIRKRIITDLLTNRIGNPDNALLRLKHIGIDFPYNTAICVIVRLNEMLQPDKNGYVDETLACFSVKKILQKNLAQTFEHYFILQVEDMTVIVLFSNLTQSNLSDAIKQMIDAVQEQKKNFLNINITFGIGNEVHDVLDLNRSFKTAKHAINISSYNAWGSAVNNEEKTQVDWLNLQNVYSDYNLNAVCSDIKNCNLESANANLKLVIDDFLTQNPDGPTPLQTKLFYINVMNTLFKHCLVNSTPSEQTFGVFTDLLDDVGKFTTVDKLNSSLLKIVSYLIEQYSSFVGKKRHWLTDKITEYIKQNYSKPLTMKDVASEFYLNPSYFCKLFKEESGVTFTHYLMKLRIEKAKELLETSTLKLYDIAAAIGYGNVQYFSTIFKEIENVTPSQYRSIHFS